MSKVFIDTLYVIALINHHDDYHTKAVELADAYERRPLITTDAVLLEIGNGLARGFKPQAVEIIDDFLTSGNVEIIHLGPELFERAYSLYRQYQDKDWGLIDCVSFVVMRDAKITDALTCDQHYVQAGFQALMQD